MKKLKIQKNDLLVILSLIFIAYLSIWVRSPTLKSDLVLDYDPWYYLRYTSYLLENNMRTPAWDLLTHFPPGRPMITQMGWAYFMAFLYKIVAIFSSITLMEAAKWAPIVISALSIIPAFILGRMLSNKWGGISTALFAVLPPTFIGVSMGGYCDTDATVIFFSLFSILSIFLAMKKQKIHFTAFAILVNILFPFTWGGAWYVHLLFAAFIPGLILFKIFERFIQTKKLKIDLISTLKELYPTFKPLIIILLVTSALGYIFSLGNMFSFLFSGLGFIEAKQIVNLSVAELQSINIFSKSGFNQIASRVGVAPLVLTLILPLLVFFKLSQKVKIKKEEIFLFLWAFATFYLILHGVRFSILFSCAAAVSAGYVIGNIVDFFSDKDVILKSTFVGFIMLLSIMYISDAMSYSEYGGSMIVNNNWIGMLDWLKDNADENSLVATWWDPGHIIAGYTGLKVHADGAHCSSKGCFPYPHNTRIQNMGRIMSTSDEQEALDILEKYIQLTPEQCQQLKQKFGEDIVPKEACEPISEMYFIASSDLIGKFTWMNYFGGYRAPIKTQNDIAFNPGICCAPTPNTESGYLSCGENSDKGKGVFVWCPWMFSLSNVQQDNDGNPIYIYTYGNVQMALVTKGSTITPVYNNNFIINHMTIFVNGVQQDQDLSTVDFGSLQKIDGLIWVDPTFQNLIYFSPEIKDSMFVRTFFYSGSGLNHFNLVYQNSEIKLFKVNF